MTSPATYHPCTGWSDLPKTACPDGAYPACEHVTCHTYLQLDKRAKIERQEAFNKAYRGAKGQPAWNLFCRFRQVDARATGDWNTDLATACKAGILKEVG